jgi:hypothetical protein
MDGADLTGARTSITSFLGTDLRKVKGLTQKQLDAACGDTKTRLPPAAILPAVIFIVIPAYAGIHLSTGDDPSNGCPLSRA